MSDINESLNQDVNSASVFLDLVEDIADKGWHGYGPTSSSENSLLYISFHVNPEKSDLLNEVLTRSMDEEARDFWFVQRSRNNRFYLCSNILKGKASELNSFTAAIEEIGSQSCELASITAQKLLQLSDKMSRTWCKTKGN